MCTVKWWLLATVLLGVGDPLLSAASVSRAAAAPSDTGRRMLRRDRRQNFPNPNGEHRSGGHPRVPDYSMPHHGKLSELTKRWGQGRSLEPPPRCAANGNSVKTLTFVQRHLVNFWHFFMGEILPVVEYLAMHEGVLESDASGKVVRTGPCLPRNLTIQGKAGLFKPMYKHILSSLGIEWEYRAMSPAVGRSTTDIQEHWSGTTLFLDSHVFQENRGQCQDGSVADKRVDLGVQWNNKSDLYAAHITSCSNLFPRLFPPHINGTRTNSCGDFYRDDSDRKSQKAILCASLESGQAERVHERFQVVQQWLLKWAGVGHEGSTPWLERRKIDRSGAVAMVQMRTTAVDVERAYQKNKVGTYGAAKRDVTNLAEVAENLRRTFSETSPFAVEYGIKVREVRTASVDGMTLKEQIQAHHDVDIFVFGHGAGMVQMIWMNPGSLALEISQPHFNRGMRTLVSPHHGAPVLAEHADIRREDVWLLHNPLCLQDHPRGNLLTNQMRAEIHKCREYQAPVNASAVTEQVSAWLRLNRRGSDAPSSSDATVVLR